MALPTLDLTLQFGDVPYAARHRAALPRAFVNRCIRSALAHDAEMTVRIVDAQEGQALNSSYRKKNYATNVLTFDYAQAPMVMADLVLCAPVVAAEAKEQVGKINANEFSTYVAVARDIAREAVKRLSAGRVKGKTVKVRLLEDASGR